MRVYETVLYAGDVEAAAAFYAGPLGLRRLTAGDETWAAFRLDDGGVLLIFDPAQSALPGRQIPSHGATGSGHIALSVRAGALDALAAELRRSDIEIERELRWDEGGRSIYVRDPAGNSVELIEGEAWG